jgi:CRISPR-associated protein Csy2
MSYLIILRHIRVENANAISGLTYGFPAITHFLGYTHALSRKLQQSHALTLEGCGVICHRQQIQAYSSGRDHVFALTRNPLTKEAKTAAFNEEGRMHMTVSLLIECHGLIANGREGAKALEEYLEPLCVSQRLAGGTITDIGEVKVIAYPDETQKFRQLMRRLLPGFALLDRSALLQQHFQKLQQTDPQVEMIDAWLDFAALKMQATPGEDATNAWCYVPKPETGYLVPIQTGYQAISPLYPAGQVEKTRDPTTPFRFTEPLYGIGEWCGLHRISDLQTLLWRYHYQNDTYLCRGTVSVTTHDEFIKEE